MKGDKMKREGYQCEGGKEGVSDREIKREMSTVPKKSDLSKDVGLGKGILWHLGILELLILLGNSLHTTLVPIDLGVLDVGTSDIRTDKLGILERSLTSEGAIKDTDRVHDETRSNLDQRQVRGVCDRAMLQGLFCDLIVSEPDTVIDDRERNDMVHKRFDPASRLGDSKDLCEQLLHQQPVGGALKVLVERENVSRSL